MRQYPLTLLVLVSTVAARTAAADPARKRWIDVDAQIGPSYYVEDDRTGSALRGAFSIAMAGRTSFEISVGKLSWDNYPDVEDMIEVHAGLSYQIPAGDLWFEPHAGVGASWVLGNDFGGWVKSFTVGSRVGYTVSDRFAVVAEARYTRVGWFDSYAYPHAELMFGARLTP